ncbi:phage tail tape measure protein [Clostridium saccharoperbutylacetonicum]|uniref:phage tail tape measure protein n=1 Tax=Clostridium saccharoperbutylacetonicum TaxID=36745 RepID=UPI0039E9A41B
MANNDGKIIIDTKLDTSGFEKDVETASKKAANDLGNGIEKAMNKTEQSMKKASGSFDGSKIEKNLNNVTKSIDDTNKKIDIQQQKLGKLKEAYAKSANPEQQLKLQEQIVNTTSKITTLEGKLDRLKDKEIKLTTKINTEDINKAVESIEKTGSKIKSIGSSMTTKVTLPVVAAFTASSVAAGEFEHQMADVAKEVKAKGEDVNTVMAQMAKNSIKWSEDYGQSTTDINKGLLVLVKDGYSGAESMEIMNTALKTARGANEDLFTVIDQLGGSLEAYGQKTDNAATTTANMAHMADTFAYISNHTKASISSLGEAFATAGQTAAALGQPMEQTAAAVGILQSSNIDASTAATSLKAGLVNLTKPTKQMRAAMAELGLQAFDSNGKMKDMSTIINDVNKGSKNMTEQQKQAAIAMIFGKESLASWNVLVAKGGDYLKNLATSAGNATGEVEELSDSMKNTPVNKMKEFEASAKALGIVFGEDVLPTLTPIIDDLTAMLKSFSELDEGTRKQIIDFALMAAATGPMLKVIGGLTEGIGGIVKFGGKLATTFGLVGEGAEIGGVALTGFSTAALAATGVAASLALGVAGVVTYNELLGKTVDTTAEDLSMWEKAVNACTGGTIKSREELAKAGLVYKDFGNGVSKEFKTGIEKATKQYHDFEFMLSQANLGDSITEANKGKITDSIDKVMAEAKTAINARKDDLQKDFVAGMTADGTGISENEQKVLDIITKGLDAKLAKVDEYRKAISNIWNKAIAEHGKLSFEDVRQIQNSLKMIEQLKIEASAKNDAESSFATNNFMERLNGLSAADASKEYTDASKTVHDNYSKLKATYKTEIDDLNSEISKAQKEGRTEDIGALKQEIEDKNKLYGKAAEDERNQRRKLLDILYEKNPSLDGNLNEITGEIFNGHDKNAQADLYNIKKKYEEVADATKDGIKHIQDANGKWHDIYVTVDEATGRITSAYDAFNGEIGGYSEKFEDQAKTTAENIKKQVKELANDISQMPTNLKLNDDNSISKIDTGETVTKLDTVIEKADKTKVAIQNINGIQLKLEFDENGALKNVEDIERALKGLSSNSKIGVDVDDKDAVEKFKKLENLKDQLTKNKSSVEGILIDEKQVKTLNEVIQKLESLPKGKNIDLKINGEQVNTIDGALDKLSKLPKETDTKLSVDGVEANSKLDSTKEKADNLGNTKPNVETSTNADDTKSKIEDLDNTAHNVKTHYEITFEAIIKGFESIGTKVISAVNSIAQAGIGTNVNVAHNYTGTGGGSEGLTTEGEHGWEMTTGENELYYLGGGTGILDHGSSVNQMQKDVGNAVDNRFSSIISKLVTNMMVQNQMLSKVANNTGQTVQHGIKNVHLNEKLANALINQMSASSGGFNQIQTELTNANDDKTKADKMKVEDNANYAGAKAKVDDIASQIEDLKNQSQDLEDSKQVSLAKSTNKAITASNKSIEATKNEIQAKQHKLEREKELAEKESDLAKMVAENEIARAKESAEQQIKIAEEKKDKLVKLAEAVNTAIKNQLDQEETNAENAINSKLTSLDNNYNKKLKSLEAETTVISRNDTKKDYNNKLAVLQAKSNNTASLADKRAYDLQIKDLQKEFNKQQDEWTTEDKKKALEEQYNKEKETLEKKLKDTQAYYSKLKETDSINAQTRYIMLNSNQEDLVKLLNSYNPLWQDAGQTLADSLLTGLNSQKQTVSDAVNEMIGIRDMAPPSQYYDAASGKMVGYASGTSSNTKEGFYLTNEDDYEFSSKGDVAYVSKGAGIRNHMQSVADMKAEVKEQVSSQMSDFVNQMRATVQAERGNMQALLTSNLTGTTNNTTVKTEHNQNAPLFHAENVYLQNENDIETITKGIGFYSNKKDKT